VKFPAKTVEKLHQRRSLGLHDRFHYQLAAAIDDRATVVAWCTSRPIYFTLI
jgi:hypothetical protein